MRLWPALTYWLNRMVAAQAANSGRRGGHNAACRRADSAQAGRRAVAVVCAVDYSAPVGDQQAGVGLVAQAAVLAAAAVGAEAAALHVAAANVAQGQKRQAVLAERDTLDQVLGAVGVGAVAAAEGDQVLGLAVTADAVPSFTIPVQQLTRIGEDGGGALLAGREGGVLGRAARNKGGDFIGGGADCGEAAALWAVRRRQPRLLSPLAYWWSWCGSAAVRRLGGVAELSTATCGERKSGRSVRLIHMAVHASADSVALADWRQRLLATRHHRGRPAAQPQ